LPGIQYCCQPDFSRIVLDTIPKRAMLTNFLIELLQTRGHLDLASGITLAMVFTVTGLILVPRTILCITSGAIFGLGSIPIILPSTTLGGVMAFMLARCFLADKLQRWVAGKPSYCAILDAVDSEGWRIVALLRFWSPVPTAVQNYLFGLTRIGFSSFTAATMGFTIPQVCVYVYLGAIGRAALLDDSGSHLRQGIMLVAALTIVAVVVLIGRKARLALRELEQNSRSADRRQASAHD
jgi:uncharacterized membrane protein YdjX (TVP38/TMEM64 family)